MNMCTYRDAAVKLHGYLVQHHAQGGLVGPDPGIRFNYRFGRFIKSALRFLPWKDNLYYVQGQGYWILGNWRLSDRTEEPQYQRLAIAASDALLDHQRADGAWEYPNPEWKGRIATAEGTWGALGLVESYRQTGDQKYLQAVLKWHEYLIHSIGFQQVGDELAVNYFASRGSGRVPNNSAFVLRFLAELADATGDPSYLEPCQGMITFLERAQLPTGELPYVAAGPGCPERRHFQCFQYNAFQCLDLMRFFELSGGDVLCPLVSNLLSFLRGGLAPQGYCYYQCGVRYRTVTYHTAVLSAAFRTAQWHGAEEYCLLADRAADYVVHAQRARGGFSHSRGEYRVLSDHRSYPRYLAMILLHLLMQDKSTDTTAPASTTGRAQTPVSLTP